MLDPPTGTALVNNAKTRQEMNQAKIAFAADWMGRGANEALQNPSAWNSILDEGLKNGVIDQATHDRFYGNFSPLVAQQAIAYSMNAKDWLAASGYTATMNARGQWEQEGLPKMGYEPGQEATIPDPDPNHPGQFIKTIIPRGGLTPQYSPAAPQLPGMQNFTGTGTGGATGNVMPTGAFVNKINAGEGGTGPSSVNIRNAASSASGPGQFIKGTWVSLMRKNYSSQTQNLSDNQVFALATDPNIGPTLQAQMTVAYGRDNANSLGNQGLTVNAATLGLAHASGPDGAAKVLRSNPNTPLSQVLDPAAIKANPNYANMTTGTFFRTFVNRFGTNPVAGITANAVPPQTILGAPLTSTPTTGGMGPGPGPAAPVAPPAAPVAPPAAPVAPPAAPVAPPAGPAAPVAPPAAPVAPPAAPVAPPAAPVAPPAGPAAPVAPPAAPVAPPAGPAAPVAPPAPPLIAAETGRQIGAPAGPVVQSAAAAPAENTYGFPPNQPTPQTGAAPQAPSLASPAVPKTRPVPPPVAPGPAAGPGPAPSTPSPISTDYPPTPPNISITRIATPEPSPPTTGSQLPQGWLRGPPVVTPQQEGQMKTAETDANLVKTQASAAQTGMESVPILRAALNVALSGPTAEVRTDVSKWVNDAASYLGLNLSQEAKDKIAAGELVESQGTALGLEMQRGLFGSNREAAQITNRIIGIKPSMLKSPTGNVSLLNAIDQGFQRTIDKNNFYNAWAADSNHLGYVGADTAFNQAYPVDAYASRVASFSMPLNANGQVDARRLEPGVIYTIPTHNTTALWDGQSFIQEGNFPRSGPPPRVNNTGR